MSSSKNSCPTQQTYKKLYGGKTAIRFSLPWHVLYPGISQACYIITVYRGKTMSHPFSEIMFILYTESSVIALLTVCAMVCKIIDI